MSLPRFEEAQPRPVPPLDGQDGATVARLVGLMRRLLADDGCPWDREQTIESLRKYVLEEAAEVADAIDSGDRTLLREELGDLLLQIVFQSEVARREQAFGLDDVVEGIVAKLVRRHPHVFAPADAAPVENADQVLTNWEKLKLREKGERGVLDGVPRALSSLVRATRIGEKVARVGFDWDDAKGSFAKVREEVAEIEAAHDSGDREHLAEEIGDLLFAVVNFSRHVGVDAEVALARTSDKFTRRFRHVEGRVKEVHGGWGAAGDENLPLDVLDRYWEEAKRQERAAQPASEMTEIAATESPL
jgi:tetrapyrrole methylase family protein/MazG family protein/ATP diphosphatase